jgi:hypothetical protein
MWSAGRFLGASGLRGGPDRNIETYGEHGRDTVPRVAIIPPPGREDPAKALAEQDAVIVKLSAAGKAVGRITLREATVKTLVLAPDGESVERLVLSFEQIDGQRS